MKNKQNIKLAAGVSVIVLALILSIKFPKPQSHYKKISDYAHSESPANRHIPLSVQNIKDYTHEAR